MSWKTLQQSGNPKTNVGHWRKFFSGPEDPHKELLAGADSKCVTEALRHQSRRLQWTASFNEFAR